MDILALHAARQPDRPAINDGARSVSWADLATLRNRLAHALATLGLRHGEHVVLYAHNSLEYMLGTAAARALGLIPVPMNHRL